MIFSNEAGHCTARLRGDLGMIGSFEAADDPERVTALLQEAANWLRAEGATQIIGPIDGDTWHRYRVNAGPFDTPPFLLEPVNPPYYDALWRTAGFEVLERYSSKRIDDVSALAQKLAPMHERALTRNYRIRPIDPTKLPDELALVWRLSLDIFRGNPFYSDIALDDFLALYTGIERILVSELVLFIEHEQDTVGFLFAYPDTDPRTVDYKTIGVVPTHRRGYVGWAMLQQAYAAALTLGRPMANHCLMREENASQSMDAGEGTTFRHYYLYALPA
ncbi:MAG TPA: GNAT family N-acetyltransferase [Thermoanaerobaculia bacterium]|nr:GNAT family N-acetyltransferase [Thermoanaerobaculia bacterium]